MRPDTDEMTYFVHESSYVDAGVKVGRGTKIWHFCHLQSGAEIGESCSLGQNVNISSHVKIGARVKIQNNVSIYEGVEIEDEVFCGPSCVFTNDLTPRAAMPKGRENYLKTKVCRGASIGANATVVCGNTIGAHAMIAAGAVVTKDVPAYALMQGIPARQVGYVCLCGAVLREEKNGEGDVAYVCPTCGRRYFLGETGLRPRESTEA